LAQVQLEQTKLRLSHHILQLIAEVKTAFFTVQARQQLIKRLEAITDLKALALAQGLIDGGFDLRVFDPHVVPGGDGDSLAARAARSLEEALAHGETIVLGTRHSAFAGLGAMLTPSQVLVELG